jgi:hypothetical protein
MNFTAPPGSQNHGDPHLLCLPASWTDIFVFFATNYLAHAATLIPRPGQTFFEGVIDIANALFIPGSGALRTMRFLILHTTRPWGTPSIVRAAKAGALCMVVRDENISHALKNQQEDWFSEIFALGGEPDYVPLNRSILGTCEIRDRARFSLIEVPPQVPLRSYDSELVDESSSSGSSVANSNTSTKRRHKIHVPGTRDIPRVIVSMLQVIWGIITLYNSRGNQIELYGYGAFGLTVAPYMFMSLLNLFTNLLHPSYSTMYLVWTPDLVDAMRERAESGHRAGKFSGYIAAVDIQKARQIVNNSNTRIALNYEVITALSFLEEADTFCWYFSFSGATLN